MNENTIILCREERSASALTIGFSRLVEFSISTNSAVSMNRRFYRAYAKLDSKHILTRLQYFKNHNGKAADEIDDDKSVLLSHIFFFTSLHAISCCTLRKYLSLAVP